MSINDAGQKIKSFLGSDKGKGFYFIILIIFVASSSFGLGRLSKTSSGSGPVRIIYPEGSGLSASAYKASSSAPKQPSKAGESRGGAYVASKKGKKYYPIGCSAGSSLKEENKVFFATQAEAESAGYTMSSSCQ